MTKTELAKLVAGYRYAAETLMRAYFENELTLNHCVRTGLSHENSVRFYALRHQFSKSLCAFRVIDPKWFATKEIQLKLEYDGRNKRNIIAETSPTDFPILDRGREPYPSIRFCFFLGTLQKRQTIWTDNRSCCLTE